MANRGGINIVTCGLNFTCGSVLTDAEMNQVYQTGLSAYNRGETVVNQAADRMQGGLLPALVGYSANRGNNYWRSILSQRWFVENPGLNRFLLAGTFRLDTPLLNSTGSGTGNISVDRIRFRYQTSAGSQTLLELVNNGGAEVISSDTTIGTFPFPTVADNEDQFCISGTLANLPPQGQGEVGEFWVEFLSTWGAFPENEEFVFDSYNSYIGVGSVMLKFYGEC